MRNTWALGGGLLIVGSIAVCGQAFAQPFGLMFERDNDVASNELGFNTYATYADILTANATSSTFSNINVNAPFSTTGITWDGSQFIVMFERDNDVTSNELGFNTYATYADILTANATSSTFSNINVNAPFSTTGIYFVGDDQGDQQVPGPTPILLMSPVLAGLVFRRVRSQKGSG